MVDNPTLLDSQYDVLRGNWPKNANEIVIVVDQNNMINDFTLCSLGLEKFGTILNNAMNKDETKKGDNLDKLFNEKFN
jgi:putative ABC transport system permease protein